MESLINNPPFSPSFRGYECIDIIYDLMMAHVAKAVLHSRIAAKMTASGSGADIRGAGEQLK